MARVEVKPDLLKWACDRSGQSRVDLLAKHPQLNSWIVGQTKPTLNQLEKFAKSVHVSIGYLFLPTPPVEQLPIPDLRTMEGRGVRQPTPDMRDVIYLCQRRQDWYRDYARHMRESTLAFIGSATLNSTVESVARDMQLVLDFTVQARQSCATATDALRLFVAHAEASGVLVMVSGVVGNNGNRTLNPDEFRGFALSDPLAPLIFINSVDSKSAQMFTLAHELAHLWLGESAISNVSLNTKFLSNRTEVWCNRVAAEFLVPLTELKSVEFDDPIEQLKDIARTFKVSSLVILRRLLDARMITQDQFDDAYSNEMHRLAASKPKKPGGSFYKTLRVRVGKRFGSALVESTLEGNTLYRDAFQLLGINKGETFRGFGKVLGYDS